MIELAKIEGISEVLLLEVSDDLKNYKLYYSVDNVADAIIIETPSQVDAYLALALEVIKILHQVHLDS